MNRPHKSIWDEIVRKLKNGLYDDIHKFYSASGGWAYLTDKFGYRHELVMGNSLDDLHRICLEIRKVNGFQPRYRKIYRYKITPPPITNKQ